MNEAEVTLAILAGGRGERMGKAKGLLTFQGQPILTYLLKRFAWGGPTMLVTSPGRERPPGAEGFDVEVVDPVEGMGPVRGLLTALETVSTPLLLVAGVDMPFVVRGEFSWLLEMLEEQSKTSGVFMRRGMMIEPFPSVFRSVAKETVIEYFAAGGRSLHSLATKTVFRLLEPPLIWSGNIWVNLNKPEDLAFFEHRHQG